MSTGALSVIFSNTDRNGADPRLLFAFIHVLTAAVEAVCIFATGRANPLSLAVINDSRIGVFWVSGDCKVSQTCWQDSSKAQTARLYLSICHGLCLLLAVVCFHASLVTNDALSRSKTYVTLIGLLCVTALAQFSSVSYLLQKVGFDKISPGVSLSLAPVGIIFLTTGSIVVLCILNRTNPKPKKREISSSHEALVRRDFETELYGLGFDTEDVVTRAGFASSRKDPSLIMRQVRHHAPHPERSASPALLPQKISYLPDYKHSPPLKQSRPQLRPVQNIPSKELLPSTHRQPSQNTTLRSQPERDVSSPISQTAPQRIARPTSKIHQYTAPIPQPYTPPDIIRYNNQKHKSGGWSDAYAAVNDFIAPSKDDQRENLLEDLLVQARELPPTPLRVGRSREQVVPTHQTAPSFSSVELTITQPVLEEIKPLRRFRSPSPPEPIFRREEQTHKPPPPGPPTAPAKALRQVSLRASTLPDLDAIPLPFASAKVEKVRPPLPAIPLKSRQKIENSDRLPLKKLASLRSDSMSTFGYESMPIMNPIPRASQTESISRFIDNAISEFNAGQERKDSAPQKPQKDRLDARLSQARLAKAPPSPIVGRDSLTLIKSRTLKAKTRDKIKPQLRSRAIGLSKTKMQPALPAVPPIPSPARLVDDSAKEALASFLMMPLADSPIESRPASADEDSHVDPLLFVSSEPPTTVSVKKLIQDRVASSMLAGNGRPSSPKRTSAPAEDNETRVANPLQDALDEFASIEVADQAPSKPSKEGKLKVRHEKKQRKQDSVKDAKRSRNKVPRSSEGPADPSSDSSSNSKRRETDHLPSKRGKLPKKRIKEPRSAGKESDVAKIETRIELDGSDGSERTEKEATKLSKPDEKDSDPSPFAPSGLD